jgi:penicillin-binding protein 1A
MPVWADAMNACAKDFGGKVIPQPESVQEVKICSISGQRATPYCYETVIEPTTGRPRTRSAEISEFFPKNSPALPVCSIHSGTDRVQENAAAVGLSQLAVIDTTPVRAKEAVLLGDDPYFTEQLLLDGMERPPVRKSNNVLDSFDLGDGEKPLQLPWPKRIKIIPE